MVRLPRSLAALLALVALFASIAVTSAQTSTTTTTTRTPAQICVAAVAAPTDSSITYTRVDSYYNPDGTRYLTDTLTRYANGTLVQESSWTADSHPGGEAFTERGVFTPKPNNDYWYGYGDYTKATMLDNGVCKVDVYQNYDQDALYGEAEEYWSTVVTTLHHANGTSVRIVRYSWGEAILELSVTLANGTTFNLVESSELDTEDDESDEPSPPTVLEPTTNTRVKVTETN